MIELSAVEKTFEQPGGERVPALRGVDLSIPAGQFLTVIGSNGSGKSTILNVIAGTYPLDAGTIGIADTDVTQWPEHKRAALLGRVFQDPFRRLKPCRVVTADELILPRRLWHTRQVLYPTDEGSRLQY